MPHENCVRDVAGCESGGEMWPKPAVDGQYARPVSARHPNSARFHEILKELGDLHDKKQADYGRGDDPFANVRASSDWGVSGWVGAMIRANDKLRRLQSLIANGKLANESAEDSLRDLAVYSIIALVLFEQERELALLKIDSKYGSSL